MPGLPNLFAYDRSFADESVATRFRQSTRRVLLCYIPFCCSFRSNRDRARIHHCRPPCRCTPSANRSGSTEPSLKICYLPTCSSVDHATSGCCFISHGSTRSGPARPGLRLSSYRSISAFILRFIFIRSLPYIIIRSGFSFATSIFRHRAIKIGQQTKQKEKKKM